MCRRRGPRWVSAHLVLDATATSAPALPVHTPAPRGRGPSPFSWALLRRLGPVSEDADVSDPARPARPHAPVPSPAPRCGPRVPRAPPGPRRAQPRRGRHGPDRGQDSPRRELRSRGAAAQRARRGRARRRARGRPARAIRDAPPPGAPDVRRRHSQPRSSPHPLAASPMEAPGITGRPPLQGGSGGEAGANARRPSRWCPAGVPSGPPPPGSPGPSESLGASGCVMRDRGRRRRAGRPRSRRSERGLGTRGPSTTVMGREAPGALRGWARSRDAPPRSRRRLPGRTAPRRRRPAV